MTVVKKVSWSRKTSRWYQQWSLSLFVCNTPRRSIA